ncbi:TPA: antA/AntB antirepressor family protein [Enterococcus faecium]
MDLIPIITNENNEQLVSGRDLHEFLGVNEKYTQWFDRMVTYGFDENVDFISFFRKNGKT